ncbi:flagellar C1a complex subunit C1a-32 [Aureococcus anophagefferens]|nr:flagellar C1a complex subunit C1a-32 [Aureococcus anophagefferens]
MELGFHIKQVHDFFYFYLFAFSRENRFSHEKTSTLLSICRDVFDGDMGTNDPAKHMGTSFERLEGMLLRHAVFRPPKSIGVFDEGDVRSILNFMLHNYYRHWRLYKVCFTRRLQCTFTQVLPFGVEEPAAYRPAYRPLVELLPLGEAPPAVLEPEPEPEEEGGEAEDGEATGEEPPADEVA